MSGSVSAGSIVYEVDIDTSRLLSARREINDALSGLNGSVSGLNANVNRTEGAMSSLSKAAQLVAGSLTIGAVIKAADDWGQMAARIKMSLNSVEGDISRYSEIQQRFLEVSNRNGKAVETTQGLYAGSATSMKELGYNTSQTIDYIESLSSSFTSNAASAQQTESAMTSLNRAIVAGSLKGNDWHAVLNAIPSAVGDVAKELSKMRGGIAVTENEVKKMAMDSGISMKLFVNAMVSAKDANNALADSMDNTVADGFTKLTNSAKSYYGELNQTYGVTRTMSAGFAVLSNNFDKVADAANIAALVVGARMVGAFTASTKAKLSDITASVNQAKAEANTARAAEIAANSLKRKAVADKESALSAQALAQAEYNVAKGSMAEATALDALVAAKTRSATASLSLIQAERAQALASVQASAAARAASVSFGLLKGALSLVGGPAGVAMLAASALVYWWQSAKQAKEDAVKFADSLDGVIEKLKEMNRLQLDSSLAGAERSIEAQKENIQDLNKEIDKARGLYASFTPEARKVAESYGQGAEFAQRQSEASISLRQKIGELDAASAKLAKTQQQQAQIQEQLNIKAKESDAAFDVLAKNLSDKIPGASKAAITAMVATMQVLDSLKKKGGETADLPELGVSPEAAKLIKQSERRLELSKLEGQARARLQAQYDAEDAGLQSNDPLTQKLKDQYAATEKNTKAQGEAKSAGKKTEAQAEATTQKLADLKNKSDLVAESTRELSREQSILAAKQSLGKGATEAQKNLAADYAANIWDISNALRAQAAAEKLIPEKGENSRYLQESKDLQTALSAKKITQDQYSAASERAEQEHQANLAKIRSDAVVSPQQESAGMVDPVQQLANENARKLALIQQFEKDKTITEQQGIALRNAANRQFEQQRVEAQYELWRQQAIGNEVAAAAFDSFSGNVSNSLTGIITGSMSASDAMRSLGATVLNSAINSFVQMGIEQAKAAIFGATVQKAAIATTTAAQMAAVATTTAVQTAGIATTTAASTAAAATTTAAWTPAAIVASIGSFGGAAAIGVGAVLGALAMGIAGKRKNGGPVSAGSMYQVGEGGMPEIYQASTGKQYMIPGDNGKVISNKDMQAAGGSGGVVVNIQNYTSATVDAQATQGDNGVTIDVIVADISNGGRIGQAISSFHQAPRRATQ